MPKKKTSKPKSQPLPESDNTLLADCLSFLEWDAVDSGWFADFGKGWVLMNRVRAEMGKKKIEPITGPTTDYFETEGEVK